MALVTKNDVTQIFAIQAPSIDLPPTFANYPRGWDTARSNNGKPTIKQFNYIQQRTDQNTLWIHQNGAALPYDATMEYAENAHVVKDGELQKKQGASWVSATNKGYNLDYFVSGKSYPLNAEVMLENGDIVKSTIADNTANPNVDMTGWVLITMQEAPSLISLRLINPRSKGVRAYLISAIEDMNLGSGVFVSTNKSNLVDNGGTIIDSANPNLMWVRVEYDVMTAEMFGCIGDGVADDTAAMTKFAAAKYSHKVAANKYALTATPVFTIEHDSTVIDFSKSTIIGTNFARNALQVLTSRVSKAIKFLAGSYDGGGVVNNYVELSSLEGGFSDLVVVECYGVLKNFSNQKNTSTTAPIKCGISCDVGRISNPIVYNVVNKNGVSGSSSSVGVALTQYRKIGLIENPIVEGVYTESGVDADGLILFEEKDVSTTGTGIGIVKNADLKQCCGRGIKSQSNLAVMGANVSLIPPITGIVSMAWRGIDAQLGGMHCRDVNYDLSGSSLFQTGNGSTLFQSGGSPLGARDQIARNITVKGDSNIRYFMQLTGTPKSIVIDNVKLLTPQSALSCLYVIAGVTVTESISLTDFSGDWWTTGNLFFDTIYNGSIIPSLNISNVAWNGYDVFNVSKFAKVRILDTKLRISGTLAYNNIHKDSDFYYLYETSASGGITYTNPNIPAFAKRACWYRKGDVLSSLKNNQVIFLDGTFYQSLTTTPTAIA